MSYIAPLQNVLDFAIGSEVNTYTPPDWNAVNFQILPDVTIAADAPLAFVASIQSLGAVYAIGLAVLLPETVIEANAPPAGPTSATLRVSALGQGASGQPATATAIVGIEASATGKVAYFGMGAANVALVGGANAGVGVGGTCAALLAFDSLAQGSTTESYWGDVDATFPLAAFAIGTIPQQEVCA